MTARTIEEANDLNGSTMVPLVSVIIPSFNHVAYVDDCIQSVLRQSYPNIEVLVVDDWSTDGTWEKLCAYGDRIKLIRQKAGRQARGRNLGVIASRGEFVAFLDSDDRYTPSRIEDAMACFVANPEADAVWCDFRTMDSNGKRIEDVYWKPRASDFVLELFAGNPICNSAITLRKSSLLKTTTFDERIPKCCDGLAWSLMAINGARFIHITKIGIEYRIHGRNDSRQFVDMTRERDIGYSIAITKYLATGTVTKMRAKLLYRSLLRQFCFSAAAIARRSVSGSALSQLLVVVLSIFSRTPSLQLLSFARDFKRVLTEGKLK